MASSHMLHECEAFCLQYGDITMLYPLCCNSSWNKLTYRSEKKFRSMAMIPTIWSPSGCWGMAPFLDWDPAPSLK